MRHQTPSLPFERRLGEVKRLRWADQVMAVGTGDIRRNNQDALSILVQTMRNRPTPINQ